MHCSTLGADALHEAIKNYWVNIGKIKHPTLKGGVCFDRMSGFPEFRNRLVFVAQIPVICTIVSLLSVSLEIP
jgi:hypothetical protein